MEPETTSETATARYAHLRSLFSAEVAVALHDMRDDPPAPLPQEAAALSPKALAKRQRDFAAGRAAARTAMAALGRPALAVLAGSGRAPVWPEGLTGSITHCRLCAMAAVADRGGIAALGLDAEEDTALKEKLLAAVCLPREQDWLAAQEEPLRLAKIIFSAKEAAYKCQYALSGRYFGFSGMELEFDLDGGRFIAAFTADQPPFSKGDEIPGRFAAGSGIIVTGAELRRAPG